MKFDKQKSQELKAFFICEREKTQEEQNTDADIEIIIKFVRLALAKT